MSAKSVTGIFAVGAVLAATLLKALPAAAGPALVFEADTGRVIYEEEATRPWQPASLAKLMTAYLVFSALKEGRLALNTEIGITPRAFSQPPTRFGLAIGKSVAVDLAVRALIIKSANDFAVALAEAVSGSEEDFVADMNAAAKKLGMTQTRFINPNGLPALIQVATPAPEPQAPPAADPKAAKAAEAAVPAPIFHSAPVADQARTSARDMGLLAQALHKEFPEFFPMFSDDEVEIGRRKAHTHNALLKAFEGADGMKTGFTCGAGYNIVASASRNGRRIIAVVLGEPTGLSRTARAEHLIDHGFEVADWKILFQGPTVAALPVSAEDELPPDMASKQYVAKCGGGGGRVTLRPAKQRVSKRVAKK